MIKVESVNKEIKKKAVLKDITVEFLPGQIYGVFGRNGSGKTMLLRSIAGLIVPTTGKVKINEEVLHEEISFPPSLGIIIENMELLPQYDAMTNLKILAKIRKVATEQDMIDAIQAVGLDPTSKLKVKKYSLGMKQRLNIAQAIFEKPDIILLDEPTNAIDQNGVNLIQDLLVREKQRGATILVSSHQKEDIEKICDHVIYMDEGRIVVDQGRIVNE